MIGRGDAGDAGAANDDFRDYCVLTSFIDCNGPLTLASPPTGGEGKWIRKIAYSTV